LPSLDSRTGTPMIPSILRLALPLSQALHYIELSDRKNWGTKGINHKGEIYRLDHAADSIGAHPKMINRIFD
jgi:hypothetical protein